AGCGALHWSVASAAVLIVASTVSVADNGLSFTSVAEAAGPSWSGKALGIQNTGQFIAASAVGPGIGALITAVGYPVAFALVALTPLAAIPLVPARDKKDKGWQQVEGLPGSEQQPFFGFTPSITGMPDGSPYYTGSAVIASL